MKLLELYNQLLLESSTNPYGNIVYHGSPSKFDLNALDLGRDSIKRDEHGYIVREIDNVIDEATDSGKEGTGLYVTKDLWSHHSINDHKRRPFNPVYDEGSNGHESAEKYANWGDGKVGYIYKIVLSNDFRFESYNYKGLGSWFNAKNITPDIREKLLQKGIDGLYESYEAVILDGRHIQSFDLIYTNKNNYQQIISADPKTINYDWNNIRQIRYGSDPENFMVRPEDLQSSLESILGKFGSPFTNEEYGFIDTNKAGRAYFNIPKSRFDLLLQSDDEAESEKLKKSYRLDHPSLKSVMVSNSGGHNWFKV